MLGLSACQASQGTMPTYANAAERKLDKDSLVEAIETEREVYKEFLKISENYIEGKHDCDDMAQEFRDVLVSNGFPTKDIRLVFASSRKENVGHMWLEMKRGNQWLAYDVTIRLYSISREKMLEYYDVKNYFPGDHVYLEPMAKGLPFASLFSGYTYRNDRFVDGKWIRRKEN